MLKHLGWIYWVMEEHDGTQCFCPIEFAEDGKSFNCILGMNYIGSLTEMKKTAKKIWKVDRINTLENPRLIFERKEEIHENSKRI